MNLSRSEAVSLATTLSSATHDGVEVAICPAFTYLDPVAQVIKGSEVWLGAQDLFWMDKGAFTSQVSGQMLLEIGCKCVVIGHSETRGNFGKLECAESTVGYFAETDETISLKIGKAISLGLVPILCVGETLAQRQSGNTDTVIRGQLEGALLAYDANQLASLVVAYEPVWAIGTGQTCDSAEAERVCGMIRAWINGSFDADLAGRIRVLYGGSVKAANAAELFDQENIDGGLVGGASLDSTEFSSIIKSAKR